MQKEVYIDYTMFFSYVQFYYSIDTRFAELIWQREPVSSTELVKLAAKELDWKKSTTYTVLRRLCERGIFQNQGGTVTSLISK